MFTVGSRVKLLLVMEMRNPSAQDRCAKSNRDKPGRHTCLEKQVRQTDHDYSTMFQRETPGPDVHVGVL